MLDAHESCWVAVVRWRQRTLSRLGGGPASGAPRRARHGVFRGFGITGVSLKLSCLEAAILEAAKLSADLV